MNSLGERLRLLRTGKRITQKQLAERIGVTKSIISAYENDTRQPSYDVLVKLALLFGTTADYLLGIPHKETIDISGLSKEDKQFVLQLVSRLRQKE